MTDELDAGKNTDLDSLDATPVSYPPRITDAGQGDLAQQIAHIANGIDKDEQNLLAGLCKAYMTCVHQGYRRASPPSLDEQIMTVRMDLAAWRAMNALDHGDATAAYQCWDGLVGLRLQQYDDALAGRRVALLVMSEQLGGIDAVAQKINILRGSVEAAVNQARADVASGTGPAKRLYERLKGDQ